MSTAKPSVHIISSKNIINPFDGLKIIGLALFTNLFSEFLTWLLIYRTKKYKETKKQIDSITKKLDINKESLTKTTKKTDKKIKQQENELRLMNFEMMKGKLVNMVIISLFTFFFISLFSNLFQGIIVAKLPFVPINLISKMNHRNILSNDLTDCSFIFLYVLCNVTFRSVIQKLLGFAPPRSSNKMPDFFGLDDNNSKSMNY